jgi:hypothetical protein
MPVNASRAIVLQQTATSVALLSSCCVLALRAQTVNDRRGSALERTVDTTVRPGDDFFAYTNGGWLKSTEIPRGKERWGARDDQ